MKRRLSVIVRSLIAALLLAAALPLGTGASAQTTDPLVQDSLNALGGLIDAEDCKPGDAADADTANGLELAYVYCNDGLPPSGGGSLSIPVPVKYHANETGDDWTGLPAPASVEEVAQATVIEDLEPERDNRISLDVDVTLPPSAAIETLIGTDLPEKKAPKNGYPVIVFMHGCCGGNKTGWEATTVDAANEQWHHSNAWFASRGYVVVTYTARGFRNSNDQGSTGTTQLDSRRYEINDYQYLVGLLADHDAAKRAAGETPLFNINPRKVAAVGGSYGGGFSWLAITDPTWKSPASGVPLRLAAAVPKYGWTDLVESLVPSGHYFDRDPKTGKTFVAPTDPKEALSRTPIGVLKQSIVAGLYATGNLQSDNHTTFPDYIGEAFTRLNQGEPYDGDPSIETVADAFLRDRSAYFQEAFWERVAKGLRVPMFVPATWTDPLFPTIESVRFYNKLKKVNRKYPVKMYLGDYQHFVANKAKEWDDLCGDDHHICKLDDFRAPDGSLRFNRPVGRVRVGINTRIDRFLAYYLRGAGKKPAADVSATTTICAANATDRYKVDEPGIEYRAPNWRKLAPRTKELRWEGGGPIFGTTSTAAIDGRAQQSDPVARQTQANKCYTTTSDPGPGVVRFVHEKLKRNFTMMGIPTWSLKYTTSATDYWIAARLLDRAPDGSETLVTRGICRVNLAADDKEKCDSFDLWGNAWTFKKGHQVVVETTQADTPLFRRDNFPSMLSIEGATLRIPVAPSTLIVDFRR